MSKRLRICLGLSLLLFCCLYFGGYIWARSASLFRGEVETFVPYGGTPSGQYEIKPIGWLALGVAPGGEAAEIEYQCTVQQLREDQELSRRLWPYYSWLASVEELFR